MIYKLVLMILETKNNLFYQRRISQIKQASANLRKVFEIFKI